jgi:hypothetical protein
MSERLYEVAYRVSETGRSRVGIRCPFCDVVTEAYVWSLAGSGKRCECGAVHHWRPATSVKESSHE